MSGRTWYLRVGTMAGLSSIVIAALAATVPAEADPAGRRARTQEDLEVRYWPSPPDAPYYPELHDPRFGYLMERPSFGIAFSGGGTRSASAVWGQLRGLARLGWLDRARYISSVSGGAWTSVPYSFLASACEAETKQGRLRTFSCLDGVDQAGLDQWFLGEYHPPGELDDCLLARERGSFVYALSKTRLVKLYLSRLPIRGDETYARAVGKRFLHTAGQYDCHPVVGGCDNPPKHRYFLAHDEQRARIAERSALDESQFVVMTPGRPFLIAGATIIAKKRFAGRSVDLFPFEMTPLYVGFPTQLTSRFGATFGGGFIEPPGWDGRTYDRYGSPVDGEPFGTVRVTKSQPGRTGVRLRYRMTLADVLGGSGAAPALALRRFGLSALGFPEWDSPEMGAWTSPAAEFAFGDGGHLENLGVIPLLGRRVENILVFVNRSRPLQLDEAIEAEADSTSNPRRCRQARRRSDVHLLFTDCWLTGTGHDGGEPRQPLLESEGAESAIAELETALAVRRAAKEPLVHCDTYRALPNARFGIREYMPRICWVVLDRAGNWVKDVPPSTRLGRQLQRPRVPFWAAYQRFPHYGTFFHRWFKLKVIDLSEQQVNALAHLTAWTVIESAGTVGPYLGLDAPTPSGPAEAVTAAAADTARHSSPGPQLE